MINIKEHIDKGYIHVRVILEVMGKPQEHVEQAINKYIEKIDKEQKTIITKKFISQAKKLENAELFSLFAELELLVKGFQSLIDFCFNYMPSSIEIYEPNKIHVDASKMSTLFNDFQEKLHKADLLTKTTLQQNVILTKNLDGMIRNALFILLREKGMKLEEVSKMMGLTPKDMEKYLDKFIKENKIRKIGDKYFVEF